MADRSHEPLGKVELDDHLRLSVVQDETFKDLWLIRDERVQEMVVLVDVGNRLGNMAVGFIRPV